MTPEQLAKPDTEAAHQTALFCWAALNASRWPELKWMYHPANGGARGDSRSAMIRGGQLKAQGVKAGVSDVCLPVKRGQWSGLYLELKKPSLQPKHKGSAGGISEEQREFGFFVMAQGFGFAVCYGWKQAAELVESYLEEKPR